MKRTVASIRINGVPVRRRLAIQNGFIGLLQPLAGQRASVIEPLTFSAVRPMSISGSTELTAPPGLLAGPSQAAQSVRQSCTTTDTGNACGANGNNTDSVAIHIGSSGLMPTVGATITPALPDTNRRSRSDQWSHRKSGETGDGFRNAQTTRLCFHISGIDAALERLVKANVSTGHTYGSTSADSRH